jgi:fatty-acyl-CoA synthase
LREASLGASFAMAETTFAVTQTAVGRPASTLLVSRQGLSDGVAREPRAGESLAFCVSSGAPIAGCELQALDPSGAELAERRVGELWVRSASLFDGYRNRPDLTEAVLRDDWYCTGDLGFQSNGEWYVVGRKKDLIIVAGKNLYPEDVELAATQVAGTIPGRAVAFGREDPSTGTEYVCVVLETALESEQHAQLRERVTAAVQQIDVTLSELYLVPPRWLVKSSSGKLSRVANRERVLAEFSKLGAL